MKTKNSVDFELSSDYYKLSEEHARLDLFVRMAHTVTGRSYWALSSMIIIAVMTLIVSLNELYSYDRKFFLAANLRLRENIDSIVKKVSDGAFINSPDSTIKEYEKKYPYLVIYNKDSVDTIKNAKRGEVIYDTIRGEVIVNKIPYTEPNRIAEDMRNAKIGKYMDAQYIHIPLLGLQISHNDILLLMGLAFLAISCWLWFCIRSENFTIGKVLTLSQQNSIEARSYLFYGICFNNMFFPTTTRMTPYKDLSKNNRSLSEEIDEIIKKGKGSTVKKIINRSTGFMFFIPLVTMGICFGKEVYDMLDIKYPSFRNDSKIIEKILWKIQDSKLLRLDFATEDMIKDYDSSFFCWMIGFSLVILIVIFFIGRSTKKYQSGTDEILRKFKKQFKHEDDCLKSISHNCLYSLTGAEVYVKALGEEYLVDEKDRQEILQDKFCNKYNEKNNFYLLTHTSNIDEVKRICGFLKQADKPEIEDTRFKNFTAPKINENIMEFTNEQDAEEIELCKLGKVDKSVDCSKREFFIFLKKQEEV